MSDRLQRALRLMTALSALAFLSTTVAQAQPPEPKSAAAGLLDGLRAIHLDAKKRFVKKHCSAKKLCSSPDAIKRMFRFNWPAAKRMMPKCLKGPKHDRINVTHMFGDEAKDSEVKVFIQCIEGQRPRPYRMHREDGRWRLANVF